MALLPNLALACFAYSEQIRRLEEAKMQEKSSENGWALVPLRLIIGFGFAAHGYAKLSGGPESFATILTAIGVPQPHLMAWVTSLLELIGGISLMAGAFVIPFS